MDFSLQGVHVLVTGAAGGIGSETTRLFCSLGANVTVHYHTKMGPLEELVKIFPGQLQLVQADLKQEQMVQDMFATIAEGKFGPVQVAIVNHGVWPDQSVPLAELSLERWNHTMSTNLTSSFLVCREYLRGLVGAESEAKDKAAIVFIGSTSGKYGEYGYCDYAASKSAMMYGLMLSLKNEIVKIAPKGRVNCVAPGWVTTPKVEVALLDHQVVYRSLATTPLKKFASTLDIANQIAVLSSSAISGHITGQVIMADGGFEGALLNMPEDIQ